MPSPPDHGQTDRELMRQVQQGQAALFDELARRYRPALLRVALSRLKRIDWAEDAVQDALLAAYKGRHTFQTQHNFRTWLWTILLNECRRAAGARARLPSVSCWADGAADAEEPALCGASLARGEPPPLARLLAQEGAARLEAALERLSSAQADALRLRFFGELKFQEIADAMGCSLGTAKNRVQWGLMRLADLIRRADHQPLDRDVRSRGGPAA